MKNKSSVKAIILSSLFATAVAVGSSLSWFAPTASVDNNRNPITGEVEDEYYASGTGAANDPYIITKPRHLYNLAWLQYLGFYNKSSGIDNHQFYFQLGANVDMGEFGAIPPIGSELNPFVGNFDGQGYVVSNVTISNKFSDYTVHPSVITGWDNSTKKQPHILGFFGIVGDYTGGNKPTNYDSAKNEFINTGLIGANIKSEVTDCLVGVAAGYVNDTDLTDSHTVLKNVVVDNSNLTLPNSATSAYTNKTTNVSDYTLVGYTNNVSNVVKASKTTYGINVDTNITYSATEEGNTSGWGGSVNMKEMYNNLHTIWTKFNSTHTSGGTDPFKYYANKEITISKDGQTTTVNSETNPTNNRLYSTENGVFTDSYSYYHAYYGYKQNDSADGNKETSSYTFVIEESSGDEDFMQLSGKKNVAVRNGQTLKTNYWDTFYGQKISITLNGNTYYLKVSGTNDVTVSDEASASLWKIENNTIYTEINEVQYFLNRSGTTTVNIGTTSNTTWNYDSTNKGYYTTYNGTNYFLNCTTTDWNLATSTLDHTLLSDGNGHYITHTSTNGAASSSTDNTNTNTWWYKTNDGYYKTSSSGTAYYLRSNYGGTLQNNRTTTQDMYVSDSTTRALTINSDGYLYNRFYSSRYHYVYGYYNGTTWRETVATGNQNPPANRTIVTVDNIYIVSDSAKNITLSAASTTPSYIKKDRTETVDASFETNHTFFPLRQIDSKPGVPDDSNTGYVVSGANYWGDPYGDIRVSRYSRSSYLNGYSGGSLSTIYTINENKQSVTTTSYGVSKFKKFDAAKTSMESVLSGDSYIYGLHFMNASIGYGGSDPVIVEKAVVNGKTYNNYELPTDCVDFNLKEKGFINFFAGTYYSSSLSGSTVTNDCFFSLNEVIRSGNSISDIKEIKGVYQDKSDTSEIKSYVYQYSDNQYSVPFKFTNGVKTKLDGTAYTEHSTQGTLPSGYTLVFDTARIKNNSLNLKYAYYFEIPMNDGEYCLGSVSGHNGAYLMYLDIAANAAKTNRTIFYEKFTLNESTYSYPVGVSLGSLTTPSSASSAAIIDINTGVDASDSACMIVKAGATGVFGMDRNGTDVALSRAQAANAPPVYCSEEITLIHDQGSSSALSVQAISTTSSIVKQVEYYDYMIISDTLLVTRVTDVSTDGGSTYTRSYVSQTKYGGSDPTVTPTATYVYDPANEVDQRSDMKIYNHSNNGARYSVADIASTSNLNIPNNKLNNTVVLVFKLIQNGSSTYDDASTVVAIIDTSLASSGTFYTYNGISIVLDPGTGTITVKVDGTQYGSSFTMTVYNVGGNSSSSGSKTTTITINGTTVTGADGQTIIIQAP